MVVSEYFGDLLPSRMDHIPLWALSTQWCTPAPHIANLRLCTCLIGAIRRHHTTLAFKSIELGHQADVLLHGFGDRMPIRSIERSIIGPSDLISFPGRVLDLVRGSRGGSIEIRKAGDVGVPSVSVVDVEGAGIDLVHAEAAVQVRERCYAGADPAGCQGVGGGDVAGGVGVVDHELVLVRVAEEDVGDHVRRVSIDDLIEQIRRVWEWVGSVPACKDVANDPNSLACILGSLQFLDQERLHTRHVRVARVVVIEEIASVPEIGIECDDSEAILVLDRVSPVMESCLLRCSGVNPSILLPKSRHVIIVPAELLSKPIGLTMRRVNGFRV